MNKKISTPIAISITVVFAVLVGAIIIWRYLEMPKGEIMSVEKVAPADETAGWRTYRNEKAGYELKYPLDWYFKETECVWEGCLDRFYIQNIEEEVIIAGDDANITENGSYFFVSVSENLGGFSSIKDKIMSYDIADWEKQRRINDVVMMEIGGEEIEVWGSRGHFEFVRKNKNYGIGLDSGSQEQRDKDLKIFDQILSTFRFLE